MQETQTRSLGWEKSSGEGNGNPLQYSWLENPHGQRTLVGYSSRDHKESDMTEWLKLLLLQTGALQVALVIKNLPADAEDVRNVSSTPGWEDAWSKIWQSVPVFLPGKFHGQRRLVGYSSWGLQSVGHNWMTEHRSTDTDLDPRSWGKVIYAGRDIRLQQ